MLPHLWVTQLLPGVVHMLGAHDRQQGFAGK
jgi:hypothetical protein